MCVFVFSGFNKHQTPGFAALALTDSVCVCVKQSSGVLGQLLRQPCSKMCTPLGISAWVCRLWCLLFLMGAAGHLQGSHHECC